MNKLQIFENSEFGKLEIILVDDKPHFPATECAKMLGYEKPHDAVERHCRYSLKRGVPHPQSANKTIDKNFIPEGDLYRLIIRSKLPSAQRFEKWVFDEVLPSIREHGAYVTPEVAEKMIHDPDFIIKLGKKLKAQQAKINTLKHQAEANQPKVDFADAVKASKTAIPVGDLAKLLRQNGIKTGRTRLFKWLRENGYLIKRAGAERNTPSQMAMEKGLFEIEEKPYIVGRRETLFIDRITRVTGKGQIYFIGKFILRANQADLFLGNC